MSVVVPPSTNRLPDGAPYGLGASFVDFTNACAGTLTVDDMGNRWSKVTVAE